MNHPPSQSATILINLICKWLNSIKPGLHFERKSTAHTQTILRTWGGFSRPPVPIYAEGIAHVPSVNTPTIRRILRVYAGLSLETATYAHTQAFARHIK